MASLFAAFRRVGLSPTVELGGGRAAGWAVEGQWQDENRTVLLACAESQSRPVVTGELVAATSGDCATDHSRALAILETYRRSGAAGLASARRDDAFALWDARARALLVGCDAMGFHAPAYAWNGHTFLLGSNAVGLLPHCDAKPGWDEVYIAHALAGLWCQRGDDTAFRGIRRMVAGEILRVSATGLERLTANTLTFDPSGAPRDLEEVVRELGQRVDRAVGLQMAQTGTCVALSGGLDSCVVATAAACTRPDVDALSLVAPQGSRVADGGAGALAAVLPQMRWHRVVLPAGLASLQDVLPMSDDPICAGAAFQVARVALARAARDLGQRRVLDGEGGDEVFDQVWWPGDFIREAALGRVLRAVWAGKPARHMIRDFLAAGQGPAANLLFGRAMERLRARRPWLRQEFWESPSFKRACDETRAFGALRTARERLPDVLAAHGRYKRAQDLMRRSLGLEGASPLLDRGVVEFIGSLQARVVTDPDQSKGLLRRLAARRVPPGIAWRPKAEPLHDWLVGCYVADDSNVARAIEVVRGSPLLSELLDPKAIVAAVEQARAQPSRAPRAASLVELFALAEWMAAVSANYLS